MKKSVPGLLAGSAVLAMGLATLPAQAVPADGAPSRAGASERMHNLPNPFATKQNRLRKKAIELIVHGKAQAKPQRGGGSVVTLSSGEAVEFVDNEKEARIWTILSEFGSESSGRYGRGAGPLHDQIAEPASTDNSTQWTNDFEVPHYDEMFNGDGESFRSYYLAQSNGEYHTTVTTEDWVTVPKNGAWYGDNANETQGSWTFIGDTVNAWYAEASKTMTPEQIDAYLSEFDVWDRYDHDGDANFNEPDGYIDHFQAIHAGEGEEAGGGTLGEDAIWSHRWYADYTTQGTAGPAGNLLGGKQIGQSKYWIGDYTVEPENGGLGVFAHEYGHDLGLPDFYDTTGGAENGSAFWTLMSSGSWLGHGDEATGFLEGIGGTPNDMGPEEKLFLGWLDAQIVDKGSSNSAHTLRPAGSAASNDAVVVPLSDDVDEKKLTTPYAGNHAWYSGSESDLTATLTRTVPAASRVVVSAKAWYNTEVDYDFWWAEYRPVGATSWTRIGSAIDGASKGWTSETFAYRPGGKQTEFRFVYKSDSGVNEAGLFLDEIVTKTGRTVIDTEGAESETSAWTPVEFTRSNGTAVTTGARYYLMENRTYVGYDDTLRTGPYQFREAISRPNWVEHFPYQDGLLIWMVNHSVPDNNTSEHPGEAYALPIDARPDALMWSDGTTPARARIQIHDATFGTLPTDAFTLQREVSAGVLQDLVVTSKPGVVTFDDTANYYNEALPYTSVETAGDGVVATVDTQTEKGDITVSVTNP